MKITDIKTFLVDATPEGGWGGGGRNWLFVKVETDEGLVGWGEASGWPKVIETAVQDLKTILIGLDPTRIELIWQKMMLGMMGHGMTGVVGRRHDGYRGRPMGHPWQETQRPGG